MNSPSSTSRSEHPGRLAVVTGAAHGIGRASALALAAQGFDLVVMDLEAAALEAVAEQARAMGRSCLPLRLDCSVEAEVAKAFAEARAFGEIDVLLNNVGRSAREKATEFWCSEPATWREVVDVSLMSVMLCSRQVVPGLRERRRGRVINMSSVAALSGERSLADYGAAKMGVIGFTRALARELAPFRVTVNALCPGAIRTRAHDAMQPERLQELKDSIPMQFVGEPQDVAGVVAFFASDAARYITGQTLLIDGGKWMV